MDRRNRWGRLRGTNLQLQSKLVTSMKYSGFSGGSVVKNLPTSAGDAGSILLVRKTPGGGNGNTF